jgi:squalene-hopene/tetraprenyl-beta-curcumene cyclase
MTVQVAVRETAAERALARGVELLLAQQEPEGFWKAELETNVTMDAEDLLLRRFLGLPAERETRLSAEWIRSQQRPDGSWATWYGGPADLSTTIEAYAALRSAGDPPDAAHLRRARGRARRGRHREVAGLHAPLARPLRRSGAGTISRRCRPR